MYYVMHIKVYEYLYDISLVRVNCMYELVIFFLKVDVFMILGERLSQAYASCDVFVMPSDSETLGFVVMEAMASGVPVVVPCIYPIHTHIHT